jgi:hypothetical protein
MIPNRCYRIPPFSVKLEITRVEDLIRTLHPCQVEGILPCATAQCQEKLRKINKEVLGCPGTGRKSFENAIVMASAHRHGA